MKRKEKTYKPHEMWTLEESELFLKYCPDPRIGCYHSIAAATGARPHEILGLTIGDIIWPMDGSPPYFTVKGKTGQRTLRIYRFENYVKQFIERHPRRAISSSPLILSKKTRGSLGRGPLHAIYNEMKEYFSKLCQDAIGQDDRTAILRLLKKPWNPYVFRQTVATEYLGSGALTKSQGDQWFGWSERSNTAVLYQNYFGDEAADSLGVYFGVAQRRPPKVPKQRHCPNINCQELNTPDAPFCVKCRIPLTIAGHIEQGNQKDQELGQLKEQMLKMEQDFKSYDFQVREVLEKVKQGQKKQEERHNSDMKRLIEEHKWYVSKFGLSDQTRRDIEDFREKLRAMPPDTDKYIPEYDD